MKNLTCHIALSVGVMLALSFLAPPSIGRAAATLEGCSVFPADNFWNTPVDDLPVDPDSDAYIATIGASRGLHPDFGSGTWAGGPIGIPFTVVDGSQPEVNVNFDYANEWCQFHLSVQTCRNRISI